MNFFFRAVLFFLLVSNPLFSMDNVIDFENINHAKTIANNILNIEVKGVKKIEYGVNYIIKDHSKYKHYNGDTYFITDSRDEIKSLIQLCVSDPDNFKFYTVKKEVIRPRLAISKKISKEDAKSILREEHIGELRGVTKNSIIFLCFDLMGVDTLSDSTIKGGFLTGFPCSENYELGQF